VLVGWIVVGAAVRLLWLGAELFVEHAASAGKRLGVTGLAVGLLLAGAEPEELITAVKGNGRIAAGDAIGANVTMLTVVLGLAALMRPLPVGGRVRRYLIGAAVLGGIAAVFLRDGVGRGEGLVLVLLHTVALGTVWVLERKLPTIGGLAELEAEEGESDVVDGVGLACCSLLAGSGSWRPVDGWRSSAPNSWSRY
jgi:cation:H+ antiporter